MQNVFGRYGLRVLVVLLLLLSGFAVLVAWGVGENLASKLEHQIRQNVETELALLAEGFFDLAMVEHYATAVHRLQVFCDSNTEVRMLRVTTSIGSILFQFQRQTTGRTESLTKVLKLGPGEQVRFEMETELSAVDTLTATTRLHVLLALLSVIVPVGIVLWLVIRKLALQPMEHSLQGKEASFFVTLNSIGDAVLSTDNEGRIVFMNPMAETLTGWSLDEARQCPVSEVFKIIDFVTREPALISVEKVLASRAVVDLADYATLIAKDGTERQIAHSGAPIRHADGKVTGVVLVCRDVSEAYAKRQQLRESEERYRAIAEDIPVLICRFLPGNKIVYVNEAYCSYFDKTPEELVGSSFLLQIPEDDRETVMANIMALTMDSPTQSLEHKVFSSGGEIRWQRWTNRALFGAEGQLVAYQAIGEDITQRKQTEQALQESQSRFALFMDYLPAAIFIKNAQNQMLYVNQYLKTHFCVEDLQGRYICVHSPVEVTEQLVRNDRKALAEGQLELVETLKDREGRERTFQTHKFVILQPEGKPALLGGIAWDITDSLAASEALRCSERRYREIFEIAQEGIWLLDAEAKTVEVNERMARMLGYTIDEMRGRHLFEFMDEEVRAEADMFQDRRRKGIAEKYDFRYRTKIGADLWTMVSSAPMQDAQGAYAGALRMVTDITERKRMEAKLREEHKFTTAILASSGALIIVLDRQGRIVRFNRACEEISGYAWEEVKYEHVWDLFITAGEMAPVKAEFDRLREGHVPGQFENYWITRHGQRRRIAWYNNALLDEEGKVEYIVSNGIDITDRRQAEEQARQHQAELTHMDRINLMGEMATGLAHELTQPLTSIYAYSQACLRMLKAGQAKSEKFANAIEQSAQRAEQAGKIIRRLRQFVRKQVIRKSWLSLHHLIEEAIAFIKVEADESGVTTCLDLEEDLPPLFVDPVQIEQVMLNLMRNSIEAMAGAGCEERTLTVAAATIDSSSVQVTVMDTGPGLNEDQSKPIFDAFFTTKKNGMGMGLAISRSIIEAHGGRLWAKSGHDKGACFHFNLPIAKGTGSDEP
jgi:two-component system sensor kinase FixL